MTATPEAHGALPILRAAPAAAARVLVVFAFYAAAIALGASRGAVEAVTSLPGFSLLLVSGVLLIAGAAGAIGAPAPPLLRAGRALALAGAGLVITLFPASLVARSVRSLQVGEGQEIAPSELPGGPRMRFGEVTLAPHGPLLLSKTVEIEAAPAGGAPVRIGLFPPTAVGPWRLSVTRFGYAPRVSWRRATGAPIVEGHVMLGTFPHDEEESRLVTWAPEANVMMGAGTFPPKLEDLVTPPGGRDHLFLRLDEATIAEQRRDLRDPDAHRWLVDGRLEDAVFFAQVFRGAEKVFEGRVRAGEEIRFAGGSLALGRDVRLWVDVLATRDPFLAWAVAGLVLLAAGLLLRVAHAVSRRAR